MLKRAIRILPLYWIISLLVLIVQTRSIPLSLPSLYKTVFIFPILDNTSFIYPVLPQGWTLAYELLFYAIICSFLCLKKFDVPKGVFIALIALTAFGYIFKPTNIIGNFILSPFWIEFAFGLLIGMGYHGFERHQTRVGPLTSKILSLTILIVGVLFMLATIFVNTNSISMVESFSNDYATAFKRVIIWGIPSALFVIGVTFSTRIYNWSIHRLFVTIGNASFSSYLIHFYVLRRVNNFFTRNHLFNADFQIILFLLLVMALGILVYIYIEKPIIKYVSKAFL